jgi:uncharacterized membrane protein
MINQKFFLRFFIFLLILAWCSGFTFNIFTSPEFSNASTPVFNFFYNNVCHQDENKLINVNEGSLLVCARCSGIYFGALLSSVFLLFYFRKKETPHLFFSMASLALLTDVLINNFFLMSYNKFSALITGLFFGFVCLVIIIGILEDYFFTKVNSDVF